MILLHHDELEELTYRSARSVLSTYFETYETLMLTRSSGLSPGEVAVLERQ